MKMKRVLFLLCMTGFVVCCLLTSCSPVQSYSEIPEIRFKELVVEDRFDTAFEQIMRKAILTFSFIDGDGDLGVRKEDKDNPASRIYYTWFQKLPDMTYDLYQFNDTLTTITSAIPYDEVMNKNEAQNKTLKGTIEIVLDPPLKQGLDTMQIRFYITDRAKNESNLERTPDFSILNTSVTVK